MTLVASASVFGVSACRDPAGGSLPLLTAGGPLQPSPPPGPPPSNARVALLGEPVSGVLRGTDPPCNALHDPLDTFAAPCQIFQVTAPSNGYVSIVISDDKPSTVACATYPAGGKYWTSCSAIRPAEMPVLAGVPYAFGVEFTTWDGDRVSRGDTMAFTLTVTFSQTSRYQPRAGGR